MGLFPVSSAAETKSLRGARSESLFSAALLALHPDAGDWRHAHQIPCEHSDVLSGHGFSRAESAVESLRLWPL